jgi:hypothetical protein
MRDNLDSEDVHGDVELWKVLEPAHLKDYVITIDDQLSVKVLKEEVTYLVAKGI